MQSSQVIVIKLKSIYFYNVFFILSKMKTISEIRNK